MNNRFTELWFQLSVCIYIQFSLQMILILSKILMKRAKELNLNFLSYHSRPSIASSQFGNCLIFHRMFYIICSPLFFNLIIVALQCSIYTILDNTRFCSLQSTLRDSTKVFQTTPSPVFVLPSSPSPQRPVQVTRCKESEILC